MPLIVRYKDASEVIVSGKGATLDNDNKMILAIDLVVESRLGTAAVTSMGEQEKANYVAELAAAEVRRWAREYRRARAATDAARAADEQGDI